MANGGVNVKMGVSGVAQFKQNISTARNSLKTLDAQLALNEKQYKATGDAEGYMQEKSQLLELKLKEQKALVASTEGALKQMAENGIDRSSKAFQDMQQQLLRAKGELIDTEQQMQGVSSAGQDASNSASEMNAQLQRIGDGVNYDNVTDGLSKITGGIEKVIGRAVEMGKQLITATLGAGAWADELKTTAAQYEIPPEKLFRMRQTSNLIDTSTDSILTSQAKLRKGLGKNDVNVLGAFAALGLDPSMSNWEDNFWAAGEAIMQLTDAEEKEAYAQTLFGRSWRELIPLFQAGRKEFDEMNAGWHWIGDENLEKLGKMDDQYQELNSEFETFKMTVLATMADVLTPLMEKLTDLMGRFNEYLQSPEGEAMMEKLSEVLSKMLEGLLNIDPEDVMKAVIDAFESVKKGIQWIIDHRETLVNALKVIAVGFAGLKIGEVSLNIWKTVNGVKQLLGLGGGKTPSAPAGGNGGTAATGGAKAMLAGLTGPGSSFSMMGGWGTLGPMAAMAAAGVAGWKMVQANLNDESLNAIYGHNGGNDSLIETMTDEQWAAVKEYWKYRNTDRGMDARDALYEAFGGQGADHAELATSYIEDAFSAYDRGWDEDGLVARILARDANFFSGDTRDTGLIEDLTGETRETRGALDGMNAAVKDMLGLPAMVQDAVASGMANITLYIDGQRAGAVLTPYVADNLGGMALRTMVTQ